MNNIYIKIFILSLCCLATTAVQAEGEFCLSGGFSSGYSCAFDKAKGSRKAVYSLQLLTNTGTEDKLVKRLEFLNLSVHHSAIVSERQHFYYLGEYLEERTAWHALDLVEKELGADTEKYRPELVSYTREYQNSLPRIRLMERGVLAGQSEAAFIVADAKPQLEPLLLSSKAASAGANTGHYTIETEQELPFADTPKITGPFYTVQLAAFATHQARSAFLASYPNFSIYCRQKNNGLYASYLGVFDDYAGARKYLHSVNTFDSLKPYVLKFTEVEMSRCSAG